MALKVVTGKRGVNVVRHKLGTMFINNVSHVKIFLISKYEYEKYASKFWAGEKYVSFRFC